MSLNNYRVEEATLYRTVQKHAYLVAPEAILLKLQVLWGRLYHTWDRNLDLEICLFAFLET